jgi:S1-C subfamily serine protease
MRRNRVLATFGVLCWTAPCLAAQGRWMTIGPSPQRFSEVDTSRITRLGDGTYQIFVQVTTPENQYWGQDRSKGFRRAIEIDEYNCYNVSFRVTGVVAYNKDNGVVANWTALSPTWAVAIPASYAETNIRAFCGFIRAYPGGHSGSVATVSMPIEQRWLIVGNNANLTLRVDTSRLAIADSGYLHVFERDDFAAPQRTISPPISEYSYTVGEQLYDCVQSRRRTLSFTAFNAASQPVVSEPGAGVWVVANPQSVLDHAIRTACAVGPNREMKAASGPHVASTGSAFPVSPSGFLLTNNHVVRECDQVQVHLGSTRYVVAQVVFADDANDIALLKVASPLATAVAVRIGVPVRPGDDVVAVGFPLTGLLADQPNVTTGSVSALAGVGDDSRYLQITSPVQPGNSGGPLFDISGHLIGIVSAKLSYKAGLEASGQIPENVNFALNASVIRSFLDAHSVRYATARSDSAMSKGAVGDRGRQLTFRVDCWASK